MTSLTAISHGAPWAQLLRGAILALLAGMIAAAAIPAHANPVPPGTDDEIRARMAPMGSLCRAGESCGGGTAMAAAGSAAGAAGGGEPRSGEAIYGQYCVACHAMGVGGAPTFADVEAWAPRIAKGMDALYQSTYTGIGVMPARGTCMDCTDEELQATVDYMVAEAQ